jgi:hypothetical protein
MFQVIESLKNKLHLLEEKFKDDVKSKIGCAKVEDTMAAIRSLKNEIAVLENQSKN